MSRDVGPMGELEFQKLCNAAGLTPNPVQQDKKGWDLIVQFPLEFSDSLDLTPLPIKAFVQVKATDDRTKKSQSITLLNMLHFVKDPSPWFLCQISFDGQDAVQRIYLMHVGEKLIRDVLKTIREQQSKGNVRLNKMKFPVKFKKEHLIEPITGESLKSAIAKHVQDGMKVYAENKSKLIDGVGYEEGNIRGTFAVRGVNPARMLLDFSLGILDGIDVEDVALFEERFGIPSNKPIARSESGQFIAERVDPTGRARLRVSESLHGAGISIDADFYSSQLNSHVNETERKFRVANRLFELIVQPFGRRVIFKIFPNYRGDKLKLRDLQKVAKLLGILNSGKERLFISIGFSYKNIETEPTGQKTGAGEVKGVLVPNDSFKDHADLVEIINNLYGVAKCYDIHDEVELTLDQLEREKANIKTFHDTVIDPSKRWFKVEFGADMDDSKKSQLEGSERCGCIGAVQASVGEYILVCIFAIIGKEFKKSDTGKLEMLTTETGYHNYLIFHKGDSPGREESEEEFDKVAERLNRDGITAIRIA